MINSSILSRIIHGWLRPRPPTVHGWLGLVVHLAVYKNAMHHFFAIIEASTDLEVMTSLLLVCS